MKRVAIAMRYRELRDDSDEIMRDNNEKTWDDDEKTRDDDEKTRDDNEKTRETIAMRRGTCVTAKREVIAKQNLLATTPNSSYSD